MRRDRGQEAAIARAVDCASAIAPGHHRERVFGRERTEIGRTVDHMTRRAEGGLGHDRVRTRHSQRRAFYGQRRRDHLARDARWLGVARACDPDDADECADN